MKNHVAAILQVSGAAALSVAGWTVSQALGLAVAGVSLLAFGIATERSDA